MKSGHRSPRIRQYRRLTIFYLLFLGILFIFFLRLTELTILRGSELKEKSEQNFLRQQRLPAPRGIIYDRNGSILAENYTTYNVYLTLSRRKTNVSVLTEQLARLLNLDPQQLRDKIQKMKPTGAPIPIAKDLRLDQITPLLEQERSFPGVFIEKKLKRRYLLQEAAAHIVGYLISIPPKVLPELIEKGYAPDDKIGATGVEKSYETLLRGQDGSQIIVRNALGKVIDSVVEQPAVPGATIYLTLDSNLQKFCYDKLQDKSGVIIVINPQNGEVLAMASSPTFDPEEPAKSPPDASSPYLNRAIQGRYFPGSTIKPILAIAALENGIKPERKIYCSGEFYLPDWRQPFLCSEQDGHGYVDLKRALQVSCNSYFYTIALELGGKNVVDYSYRFNLGRRTGIDLPFEDEGFLPLYNYGELTRGLLIQFGIGQGRIQTTPLQLVCAYAAIANSGWIATPHLLLQAVNEAGEPLPISPKKEQRILLQEKYRSEVLSGLFSVVNEPGGTGYSAQFKPQWKVAGKTGTAQNSTGGTDAWFIGFAPVNDPRVLVLVLIENGGHGGKVAAPIARDILAFYFSQQR